LAWSLVSAALLLMAVLGMIGAITYVTTQPTPAMQVSILTSLLISALWLAGILTLLPAQQSAQRDEEAHHLLVEDSLQGLVIFQSERFVFANHAFAQLAGASVDEVLTYGQTEIQTLFQSEEAEHPLVFFRSFPQDLSTVHHEVRLVSRDGVIVWVEIFIRPTVFQGQPAVQAAVIDITERRRYQQALYESEQRHRLISAMISDYVYAWRIQPDGSYSTEWVSGAFERITGRTLTQIQSMREGWISMIHLDDHQTFRSAFSVAQQQGDSIVEYRIFTPDGKPVWLRDYLHALYDSKTGKINRLLGAVQDISAQKQAEQALRASEIRWRSLVENAPAIITTVNPEGIVISINRSVGKGFPGLMVGHCLYDSFPPSEDIKLRAAVESVFGSGRPAEIETRHIGANGEVFWFQNHAGPIRDDDEIESVILLSTDITARKHAEDKLRFFSTHDTLTGLYNRAFFEGEIERLQGSRQYPISIVVTDVNGLKETNDMFGHTAGDDLLRAVAHVLRDAFRDEDVIARIGGDEFATLLVRSDESVAEAALDRLRLRLRGYNAGQNPFPLSIASGAATARATDSLAEIIKLADDRMYIDKLEQKAARAM
jgi:diguanylate cyclase (GGDEF)-like protein/PAS domain S-box-containing protein